LQARLFEVAKAMPMDVPLAFKAVYRVLLDRDSGPKAGNLLAFLKPEFVINRFNEVADGFELPIDFQAAIQFASLDIQSDQPLSIVALRMTTNQRNEPKNRF
jgi:hypothetical protein